MQVEAARLEDRDGDDHRGQPQRVHPRRLLHLLPGQHRAGETRSATVDDSARTMV